MRQPSRVLASALILSLLLGGCSYKQHVQNSDQNYGTRQKNDPKMQGSRMYGTLGTDSTQHQNRFFEYSSQLSRDVTRLNGIGQAIVMLTDKNAYVGIVLDGTATHAVRSGSKVIREQNNGGWMEGVYNHQTGSDKWDNRQLVTPYNSYFSVNDHNELSSKLKQTIAVRVRKLAPAVQEVHITANRDLVNQFVEYSRESWAGNDLSPYVKPFNILVQKHFAGGNEMPVPLQIIKQKADKNGGKAIIGKYSGSDPETGSFGNPGDAGGASQNR
ncbi:YhcN/YlaJ family sporulation lipoprotein [Paenibacillus sp. D51F]